MKSRKLDDDRTHIDTGGGAYVEGDVYTSGGDYIGRDQNIYQGPTFPRLNYRSDIADIIAFYTQTFVGREHEWTEITQFAGQETPGYMLVEAPAGYGKTALVAHLVQRHEVNRWEHSPVPRLLYFFIRQEGQRHTPVAFLQAINSQLLDLLNLSGGVPADLNPLRGQFSELWAQALEATNPDHPLLVFVDGLDEQASGEVAIAHLLPANLANYVHIVVTSRPNPEPLTQTSLEHPFRQAGVLRLHTFDEREIEVLLQEYGAPADVATKLTSRVLTITQGEPLFARFVCEEVAVEGATALARLEKNPPANVEAYFKQQLEQLKAVVKGELARDILGLLLVTLGGITTEEIAEVLDVNTWDVNEAIKPTRRFLLGETNLELMHLQLRKVVAQEFGQREQKQYRQLLLNWCRSYQQQNWPMETPAYIVAHYARHLDGGGQQDDLYALVTQRWMNLKFERTYSHRAFAEDVNLAIQMANVTESTNWVQLSRHCLIYATLISRAYFAPSAALGVLVQVGQTERAFGYANMLENWEERARAYVSIGHALLARREQEKAVAVFQQTLGIVNRFDVEMFKAELLDRIILGLVQAGDKAGLTRAFTIVKEMRDETYQIRGLRNITQAFVEIQAFEDALSLVGTIQDERIKDPLRKMVWDAAKGLEHKKVSTRVGDIDIRKETSTPSVAAQMPRQRQNLDQVLAIISAINDEERKAIELGRLAHILAQMGDKASLTRVLATVEAIRNEWVRASGLSGLAQAFAMLREVDKAVQVAESIENQFQRLWALSEVAAVLLQVGLKDRAIELTNRVLLSTEVIGSQIDKAPALSKIAQALAQAKMQEQSMAVIAVIEDKAAKVTAFVETSQALNQIDDKTGAAVMAGQALFIAETIEDEWVQALKFGEVAQALMVIGKKAQALEVSQKALVIAERCKDQPTETVALNQLAEVFVQLDQKDKAVKIMTLALTIAEADETHWIRSRQLNLVAQSLARIGERDIAMQAVDQALAAARAIDNGLGRAYPLTETVQTLAQLREFDQALRVAGSIEKRDDKAFALGKIVRALAEEGEFNRALIVTEKIEFKFEKARVLSDLAFILTQVGNGDWATRLIDQALATAETEQHENLKVSALSSVAQTTSNIKGQNRAVEILNQAMTEAMAIERDRARSLALNTILAAASQIGHLEQTQRILQSNLTTAQLAGRDVLFEALEDGALALASLDQGETLWQIYEAIMEVESWWEPQTA